MSDRDQITYSERFFDPYNYSERFLNKKTGRNLSLKRLRRITFRVFLKIKLI